MKGVVVDSVGNITDVFEGSYDKGTYTCKPYGMLYFIKKYIGKKIEIQCDYDAAFVFRFDGHHYKQMKVTNIDELKKVLIAAINDMSKDDKAKAAMVQELVMSGSLEKVFDSFETGKMAIEQALGNPRENQQKALNIVYILSFIAMAAIIYMLVTGTLPANEAFVHALTNFTKVLNGTGALRCSA